MFKIDQQSVDYAFKRLVNFNIVNKQRPHQEKLQGLVLFCESTGMDPQMMDYLYDICEQTFQDKEPSSSAFIGTLIGLAVAENLHDRKL